MIQDLAVRCQNVPRSCTWEGTVGTLEEHVATCEFTLLPCPNSGCPDQILRKDLCVHLEVCSYREHECPFCGEKGKHSFITLTHYSTCQKLPIFCPNYCHQIIKRCDVGKHTDTECENAMILCKYERIGCDMKLKRKDMAAHEQDDKIHLHMAMNTTVQLQERIVKLEEDAVKSTITMTQLQVQLQAQQNHFVSSIQAKMAA